MRFSPAGLLIAAVVVLLLFLPRFGLLYGAISSKAMLVIAAADLMLLMWTGTLYRKGKPDLNIKHPLVISIAVVVAIQLLAAVTGIFFAHSFWGDLARSTGVWFLLHIAFLAIASGHLLRSDDWTLVRRAAIVSGALYALFLTLGVHGIGLTAAFLWLDLGARGFLLGNETYSAMCLFLVAVLGAIEFIRSKSVTWRWISGTGVALIAVSPVVFNTGILLGRVSLSEVMQHPMLLLGLTRATGLVFFVFFAFLFGWWALSHIPYAGVRKWLKATVASVATLGVLFSSILLITPGSIVQEAFRDKTTIARYLVWESTSQAIWERPLLGWGPENFDRVFEERFTTELYEKEGKIEVWFDKAHNAVVDTFVSSGVLGLLSFVLLLGAYAFAVLRARRQGSASEAEEVVLLALPVAHFLQLQTAFDLVPTYALLAVIGGYVLSLEAKDAPGSKQGRNATVAIIAVFGLASLGHLLFYDLPRQASLAYSLSEPRAEARRSSIDFALSRTSDFEGLHRTSNLYAESVLEEIKTAPNKSEVAKNARVYLAQYLAAYEKYLAAEPDHYRARMNYAYLLILDTEWGGERAGDARMILDESHNLSPGNPLTYALLVMAHVYEEDFTEAHAALAQMKSISSTAALTLDVETWLLRQEKEAPRRTFLWIINI